MPTISGRCSANSTSALPKGAATTRCPSPAIEAIIAEVVRRGFFCAVRSSFYSCGMRGIQYVDRLLPLAADRHG